MRVNQPVTRVEHQLQEGAFIVSMTDTQGNITFVNDEFVRISGFTRDELIGQPHNLVRHPEMPPAAFADLWATVKAGEPWHGMVKNRSKNGDFYWVDANVTPIKERGAIVGYVSIRSKPSRSQVREAEWLYARVNQGMSLAQAAPPKPWIPFPAMGFVARVGTAFGILIAYALLLLVAIATFGATPGLLAAGGALALAGGIVLAAGLVRAMNVQMGGDPVRTVELLKEVAYGNMRVEIETRPGDVTSVLAMVRIMQSRLKGMINRIRFDAQRVSENAALFADSTQEISKTSQELAHNAEDQRTSVERISPRKTSLTALGSSQTASSSSSVVRNG